MKYLNYPIVGDPIYGIDDYDTYRTMLHSYAISFKTISYDRKITENVSAIAPDPFINEIDPSWSSKIVVNKINI
jgi:hypothetical protein